MLLFLKNHFLFRVSLAVLTGLLGAWAFSAQGGDWLIWIWLIPLLRANEDSRSGLQSWLLGLSGGLSFFTGSCYWIVNVLVDYGGIPWPGAIPSFLLLALYLSLFLAFFQLLFTFTMNFWGEKGIWVGPFFWVALEYLRGTMLTGFPWCLSGYALVNRVGLCQIATVTGVYGLSFLTAAINILLWNFLRKKTLGLLGAALGALILLAGSDLVLQWDAPVPAPSVPVRIVQTNLSIEQKWIEPERSRALDDLARLSLKDGPRELATGGLLVWPETPAPFYYNWDENFRERMNTLAIQSRRSFLLGVVDFKGAANQQQQAEPTNSLVFLSPQGRLIAQYDKIHLVPFGEYVPYPWLFFFIDKISTEAGNFVPGNLLKAPLLPGNHQAGGFICYESIFPDLVRGMVNEGAEVLVNITNDGWFGHSTAPYQHLNMARLRAVENRRYLLRAANNGISAVIDPWGRVHGHTDLFVRGILDDKFDYLQGKTFYTREGDWFALFSVFSTGGVAVVLILKKILKQQTHFAA
jgi:apolipoprotein N-acyltransferase